MTDGDDKGPFIQVHFRIYEHRGAPVPPTCAELKVDKWPLRLKATVDDRAGMLRLEVLSEALDVSDPDWSNGLDQNLCLRHDRMSLCRLSVRLRSHDPASISIVDPSPPGNDGPVPMTDV